MKLTQLQIQNFRSIQEETIIFNDYTCLVGPNGGGKSTIFTALNIFFRETVNSTTDLVNLEEEDFHHKQIDKPIVITATFEDLSAEAQEDFKDYFRQGKLIISAEAVWDGDARCAAVKQFGQRLGMEAFKPYFKDMEDKSAADLKVIYTTLKSTYADLPAAGSKAANAEALQKYESEHPELCALIPSEDQFYGVSRGANRLAKYIQWVFIPAIKDAASEQTESKKTALGQLIDRTIRSKKTLDEPLEQLRKEAHDKYEAVLKAQQSVLDNLSASLNGRLQTWAHPNTNLKLKWQDDVKKLVDIASPLAEILAGEGDFKGKIMRFGHGLQRSYIFALLQELAENNEESGPKLLLACEEPELFQHPPQARYLASIFQKLSTQNAQVAVCSHSPFFVSGKGFEDVRLARKKTGTGDTIIKSLTFTELSNKIASVTGDAPISSSSTAMKVEQVLSPAINEIFFANTLILVEGLEDIAYIHSYLAITDRLEEFRHLGCHIVPCNGKDNIISPLIIATSLGVPTFTIFDSDGDKPDNGKGNRAKHEKYNRALQAFYGVPVPDPFPTVDLWSPDFVAWSSNIGQVIKNDIGVDNWNRIEQEVRTKYDIDAGDMHKNTVFIGYMLSEAWDQGLKSNSLEKLIEAIIQFAKIQKSQKILEESAPELDSLSEATLEPAADPVF
jgi:predicted ATP-dependent endonuclease of OLD family